MIVNPVASKVAYAIATFFFILSLYVGIIGAWPTVTLGFIALAVGLFLSPTA